MRELLKDHDPEDVGTGVGIFLTDLFELPDPKSRNAKLKNIFRDLEKKGAESRHFGGILSEVEKL